jgi:hypothetical protein
MLCMCAFWEYAINGGKRIECKQKKVASCCLGVSILAKVMTAIQHLAASVY